MPCEPPVMMATLPVMARTSSSRVSCSAGGLHALTIAPAAGPIAPVTLLAGTLAVLRAMRVTLLVTVGILAG